MDPNLIMDHLAQAEVHVAKGVNHIKRQRQMVEKLARDGHDITESTYLLGLFEELQAMHVRDRDRLRAKLADVMKQLPGIDPHTRLGRLDAWSYSRPIKDAD